MKLVWAWQSRELCSSASSAVCHSSFLVSHLWEAAVLPPHPCLCQRWHPGGKACECAGEAMPSVQTVAQPKTLTSGSALITFALPVNAVPVSVPRCSVWLWPWAM